MALALPITPTLPTPPKQPDQFKRWAADLTVHLQKMYRDLSSSVVTVSKIADVGSSGGTPAITYGSTPAPGASTKFIRIDDRLIFPQALKSVVGALAEITVTDNSVDTSITGNLGDMSFFPAAGFDVTLAGAGQMRITLAPSASSGIVVAPDLTAAPANTISVQGRPSAGTRVLLNANWFSAGATPIDNTTFTCWNAAYGGLAGIYGATTPVTFTGFDASTFSISPSATSGTANNLYVFRGTPQINANNGGWNDVATGFFRGVRRQFSNITTLTLQTAVIIEPPTASVSDQIALKIRNAIGEQAVATTNRIGIDIDASNSTAPNVFSIRTGNMVDFSSASAKQRTVLNLHQLATGAVAGAHINMDDKTNDPPAPNTGDMWRNGGGLFWHSATINHCLNPLSQKGDLHTRDANIDTRLAVGPDGTFVYANSADLVGMEWNYPVVVNSATLNRVNLNDTLPAAPDATVQNVKWQKDFSVPANVSAYAPEGGTWHTISADLGVARSSGFFDVAHPGGLVSSQTITVQQSGTQIGSKGNATDEGEFDMIQAYARVTDATHFRVYWWAQNIVVGTYNFAYSVGA